MMYIFKLLLNTHPDIPLQTVLQSSSQQAEQINRLSNWFYFTAAVILLTVTALTAYVLYRFRESKQQNKTSQSFSSKWEMVMIGVPSLLVAIFLYLNINTLNEVNPPVNNQEPDVVITGYQWWWQAEYPQMGVRTANEIHLPAGKKILLKLLSGDVIHSWWIPQLGNKMDIVPSQVNYLWLTINKPGEYYGVCSEFCGMQHANMRIKIVAQTPAGFTNWLEQQRKPAADVAAGLGKHLFLRNTCGNCHRIEGTNANGTTGPDLTHIASRQTLLAGLLVNNEQNMEDWIRHPQQIKRGAYMPNFLLPDSSVKAITLYLQSLE